MGSRVLRRMRPELASAMAFGLALDTSTSDVGPQGFAAIRDSTPIRDRIAPPDAGRRAANGRARRLEAGQNR